MVEALSPPLVTVRADLHGIVSMNVFGEWQFLGQLDGSTSLLTILESPRSRLLAEALHVHGADPSETWPDSGTGIDELEVAITACGDRRCRACSEASDLREMTDPACDPVAFGPGFADAVASLSEPPRRLTLRGGEVAATPLFSALADALGDTVEQWAISTGGGLTFEQCALVESLRCSVEAVMVGVARPTVESLLSEDHTVVREEMLDRLRRHAENTGMDFALTFLLMRENWQELGDVLRRAEDWGVTATVRFADVPTRSSVLAMPAAAREDIARSLQRRSDTLRPELHRNREVWDDAVDCVLKGFVTDSELVRPASAISFAEHFGVAGRHSGEDQRDAGLEVVSGWSDVPVITLVLDQDDIILDFDVSGGRFAGVAMAPLIGQPLGLLGAQLMEQLQSEPWIDTRSGPGHMVYSALFCSATAVTWIRCLVTPVFEGLRLIGTTSKCGVRDAPDIRPPPPVHELESRDRCG